MPAEKTGGSGDEHGRHEGFYLTQRRRDAEKYTNLFFLCVSASLRRNHGLNLRSPRLHKSRERHEREVILIQVVVQIEHLRETRAGRKFLIPASIAALRLEQVLDAMLHAQARWIAAGDQARIAQAVCDGVLSAGVKSSLS